MAGVTVVNSYMSQPSTADVAQVRAKSTSSLEHRKLATTSRTNATSCSAFRTRGAGNEASFPADGICSSQHRRQAGRAAPRPRTGLLAF